MADEKAMSATVVSGAPPPTYGDGLTAPQPVPVGYPGAAYPPPQPVMAQYPMQQPVMAQYPPPQAVVQQPGVAYTSAVGGTVITVQQQPQPLVFAIAGRKFEETDKWKIGLCDICHNPRNFLCVYCCSCVVACDISRRFNENPCYPCFFSMIPLNVRFRTIMGIKDDMCNEGCTFCFCGGCAQLRLLNEMDDRGFDMHRA